MAEARFTIVAELVTMIERYRKLAASSTRDKKQTEVLTFSGTVQTLLTGAVAEAIRRMEKPAKDKAKKATEKQKNDRNAKLAEKSQMQSAALSEFQAQFAEANKKNDAAEVSRLIAELMKTK